MNSGIGLTILVISTLLMVVAIPSQDAFASNGDGPKQKHIDKHEEKHGDKHIPSNDDEKKVLVCHIPPGNPESAHTLSISKNALQDHLDNVDVLGECGKYGEETSQRAEMNQFKGSGNDYAPTLGSDRYGNNYVDDGFTFNDFVTDVENFKTHMPLQTLKVGELNTAVLKIYDNRGAGKIEHVELAFGLDSREYVSQSENSIIWTQNFKGKQSIIENDPDNLLMDVSASGIANDKIMEITFNFTFREPMDKSKIGIVVWDHDRHSRTIYFNEGIEVVGASLNPQEIITVLDEKGYPVQITMTGKDEGIDEDGNIWTHNSPWTKQKIPMDKTLAHENPEPVGNHGFDRSHNMFDSYKNTQAQTAQEKLIEILGGRNINNFSD